MTGGHINNLQRLFQASLGDIDRRVIRVVSIQAWGGPHQQLEAAREDRLRICENLTKNLSGWRSEVVFFNSETGETLDV